jgi:polar amino acid transport system substrate-binding protein
VVERKLPKLDVVGSIPIARSRTQVIDMQTAFLATGFARLLFALATAVAVASAVLAQEAAPEGASETSSGQVTPQAPAETASPPAGEATPAAPPDAKAASTPAGYAVPLFRHIDRTKPLPDLKAVESLRFALDDEFPPFSFKESTGALNGFNVAIANAICQELKLACEFTTKKWDDLMPALERGEVDAVIAGVKVTEDTVETADFTNAYYRSLARFAVRKQNPLTTPDTRSLAGKRIGVVKGSAHEAWVMQYYSRSNIRPFATSAEAFTALRGAVIDAYFGDSLQIMFWLTGEDSQDCCRFAEGAYNDPEFFSHGMAIAVKRGNAELKDVLDYGLDRLQTSGKFASIFREYFPLSPF